MLQVTTGISSSSSGSVATSSLTISSVTTTADSGSYYFVATYTADEEDNFQGGQVTSSTATLDVYSKYHKHDIVNNRS